MKKLSIICVFTLVLAFMTSPAFAASYCKDFLETGNPGGWGTSLKTFEEDITTSPGETVEIDIWINQTPGAPTAGGFFLDFQGSTDLISITEVKRYNNDPAELPGPWTTPGGANTGGEGTRIVVVPNLGGANPDGDGDIIIAKVTIECLDAGVATFTITTIPGVPTWGPEPPWDDAEIPANTFTINISSTPVTTSTPISTTSTPMTTSSSSTSTTISTTTIHSTTSTNTPPKICLVEKIYGENSEEVELLRNLRDNTLRKTPLGQEIITLYYQWSPAIVKVIEGDEEFREQVRQIIDGILLPIESGK